MLTLGETLDRATLAFPDKEAVVIPGEESKRLTYAELNEVTEGLDAMTKGIRLAPEQARREFIAVLDWYRREKIKP